MIVIWDINPEPWTSPTIPRRGRPAKDGKLVAYQQAVQDEIEEMRQGKFFELEMYDPDDYVHLTIYFWRSSAHGQQADATNLLKSTEDALQGILFKNDRKNWHVESAIVEQTPETRPCIVIDHDYYRKPVIDRGLPPEMPGLFADSNYEDPGDIF